MKKLFLTSFAVTILSISLFFSSNHDSIFMVYGIGTPDEYGNVLCWHTVEQYNGTDWVILLNHTTSSDWSQRVEAEKPIRFQIEWRLNNTLAIDEAEAISYTKILMNITGIWTNKELNNTSSRSDETYFYGVELGTWNQTGKPQSGVTYNVQTRYEAYY